MKKIILISLLTLFLFPLINSNSVQATSTLATNSSSAILIESTTGKILYEKNSDEELAPASMTKMMTLYLIYEALSNNSFGVYDTVTVSEYASSMGGSQVYLAEGEQITIDELLRAIAIGSANDAAVQMSEIVAGTESTFVTMMNERVKEWGLVNTNFMNSTGLDEDNHYSSAHDMAIIGKMLINDYPEVLELTSIYESTIRNDSTSPFSLFNTNKLVKKYDNIDGLKTGYTDSAKYCLTSTMYNDSMRVIAVVMGAETSELRNSDTVGLLNYGLNNYKITTVLEKYKVYSTIQSLRFESSEYNVISKDKVSYVSKKNASKFEIKEELELNLDDLDNVTGTVKIYINGKLYDEVELGLNYPINKVGYFEFLSRMLKSVFSN